MSERESHVESMRSRQDLLKQAIGATALATGALTGGIIGMSASPTEVETELYKAQIEVLSMPEDTSYINGWTNAGDINLNFDSLLPPPGLKVAVQAKEAAVVAFNEESVSLSRFTPTQEDLQQIEHSAILQLASKFVAGMIAGEIAVLPILALGSNPLLRRKIVVATTMLGVGIGVAGGTGLNFYQTYNPDSFSDIKSTGILKLVESNIGMLSDIEDRFKKTAPYVKDFLLLSEALKKEFIPPELDQPAAARFLLVSDIHGVNQYALIEELIAKEDISAIIDSGDLINFGSVAEAEAAGIFDSIAKLPVPYIFVDGNHDALTAKDQSLLDRMSKIPNVILLQYNKVYNIVSVNGVTIAGYNDPRYATDDGKNTGDKQIPSIEEFNETFADKPTPNVVVAHEPAIEKIEQANVTINGHMHKSTLKDKHIGVGTFTGAGIVSLRDGVDENGNGQPSAFDILSYGEQCTPTSLLRVVFNGALNGEPVYDEITTINGQKLGVKAQEGAVCDEKLGVTIDPITSKQKLVAMPPPGPGRAVVAVE